MNENIPNPKYERQQEMNLSSKREGEPQKIETPSEYFGADSEIKIKEFIEFRKNSAASINREICETFVNSGITDEQIESYFHTDPETTKIIRFVLESFSKPKDPSKARRKDGSYIAAHSLQLFLSARDYFKIEDADVFKTVLVHDIIEDTQISQQDIKDRLGEKEANLAFQMTEEHVPEEISRELEKTDKDRLSIVRFCQKLKSGGDTIALAEIVDRADDISDLAYLTQKLETKPEEKEKVRQALIAKFGKCIYTVDAVAEGKENKKVQELKHFFKALISQQIAEMKDKFGLEITPSEIEDEIQRYKKFESGQ